MNYIQNREYEKIRLKGKTIKLEIHESLPFRAVKKLLALHLY